MVMFPEKGGEFLELPVVDVFVQLGTQFVGQPEIEVLSGELVDDRPLKALPWHARVDIEEPGFEVDHGVRSQNLVAGPVEKIARRPKTETSGCPKASLTTEMGASVWSGSVFSSGMGAACSLTGGRPGSGTTGFWPSCSGTLASKVDSCSS